MLQPWFLDKLWDLVLFFIQFVTGSRSLWRQIPVLLPDFKYCVPFCFCWLVLILFGYFRCILMNC